LFLSVKLNPLFKKNFGSGRKKLNEEKNNV
jgi:hypothetical protein